MRPIATVAAVALLASVCLLCPLWLSRRASSVAARVQDERVAIMRNTIHRWDKNTPPPQQLDVDVPLAQWAASSTMCVTVPGLDVTTSQVWTTTHRVQLHNGGTYGIFDTGSRLCPAMLVHGGLLQNARSPAVLDGNVYVAVTESHTFLSLSFVLKALHAIPRAYCDACVHGIRLYPACACECDWGWTGATCNHTDTLPVAPPPPPPPVVTPPCLGPKMNCTERENWGSDFVGTNQYLCGGGYQYESPDVVWLSWLECPSGLQAHECRAHFEYEAPLCCAPGAMCSQSTAFCEPSTLRQDTSALACCAPMYDETACLSRGCAWCPKSTRGYCVPVSVAEADPTTQSVCRTPGPFWTIRGHWHTEVYDCRDDIPTGPNANICDMATRRAYLALYNKCEQHAALSEQYRRARGHGAPHSLWNDVSVGCLADVRVKINAAGQWPRLASRLSFAPDTLYRLAPITALVGDTLATWYLGIASLRCLGNRLSACRTQTGEVGLAVWHYTAAAFHLVAVAGGYIVLDGTQTVCLGRIGDREDGWQTMAQYLGPLDCDNPYACNMLQRLPMGTLYWFGYTAMSQCLVIQPEAGPFSVVPYGMLHLVAYQLEARAPGVRTGAMVAPATIPIPLVPSACPPDCVFGVDQPCGIRSANMTCVRALVPESVSDDQWAAVCCPCLWAHSTYRGPCQ